MRCRAICFWHLSALRAPKRLTCTGTENALSVLLEALPTSAKHHECIWFWATRNTSLLLDRVRCWRGRGCSYVSRAPKSAIPDRSWHFAIAISRANNATNTCRLAYRSGRPSCILVPSNLLHYAAQNHDGTFDRDMSRAIDNSPKYSILAASLV